MDAPAKADLRIWRPVVLHRAKERTASIGGYNLAGVCSWPSADYTTGFYGITGASTCASPAGGVWVPQNGYTPPAQAGSVAAATGWDPNGSPSCLVKASVNGSLVNNTCDAHQDPSYNLGNGGRGCTTGINTSLPTGACPTTDLIGICLSNDTGICGTGTCKVAQYFYSDATYGTMTADALKASCQSTLSGSWYGSP